jgi:hypothetical protein
VSRSKQWRESAEALREFATMVQFPELRAGLLNMAAYYERRADEAEAYLTALVGTRKPQGLGRPSQASSPTARKGGQRVIA